jgi:hypothetical protein
LKNDYIIGGVMRKLPDLAGELAALHDQVREVKEKLGHVEATLRLLESDIDFSGARVSRLPGPQAAD